MSCALPCALTWAVTLPCVAQGKCPDLGAPLVLIRAERNTMTLHGDLLDIADKATRDFIPAAKDDRVG